MNPLLVKATAALLGLLLTAGLWAALAPGSAAAYSQPNALGSDPSLCPPRPADDAGESGGPDTDTLAQELQDGCELSVAQASAALAAAKATDGDVTATGSADVRAIDALDADVQQLDADVKSESSADAPSSTVAVSNFPADQTVSMDGPSLAAQDGDAHALDNDLWVIVGAVVGCFVMTQVLERLWP